MNFYYNIFRTSCIILISFFFIKSNGQSLDIHFRHIKSENGLSNSTIETIVQDYRGFLWFGTRDGLNRYDGSRMITYRNNITDSSSISDNYITTLFEDKQHYLWIGTLNGLNKYDPKLNSFTKIRHQSINKESISSNYIRAVYGDTKGRIWIGTLGGGINLYQYEKESFKHIACKKNTYGNELNIYTFFEDSRGNLWAGTESGLYLYNNNSEDFTAINLETSKVGKLAIRSIAENKNGTLLLGMDENGLIIFNPSHRTVQQYLHSATDTKSISSNLVRSVYVSKKGEIWIGSINGGLDNFDALNGTFTNYQYQPDNSNSLSQRTVSVLYEDKQSNLWIGTHRGGVNLYTPGSEKFNLYRQKPHINSLSYNDVKTFCEDRQGNIWIGTDGGGLNLFNRKIKNFKHYKYDPFNQKSIGSNEVIDLKEDKDGNLWVGTWGGGLCLYNKTKDNFTRFKSNLKIKGNILSNYIQCIGEDYNYNLLIGTYYGGLHKFDKKNNSFIPVRKSISGKTSILGNNIISISTDKEGNLWICTDDGGLNKLNKKTGEFEHYFHNDDKKPDLRIVFTDSKGNVWIGQTGLYLFDKANNRFNIFTEDGGLSTLFIKGIVEDNNGQLWISTSNGLKQLDPKTKNVLSYNKNDGLQDMEFEANAFLKTKDGEIYFGGVNGFNSFYPSDIKVNNFIPPVFVTDLQVYNKTVTRGTSNILKNDISFTDELTLTYKQATFSFGFAALNYIISENNHFVYKLENWDKEWIKAGFEQRASYTNVSPGSYTFIVKASNNDGIWNEKGYRIKVTITPPFWETWWFRLIAVATLLAASIYIYRIRRKIQLQRYEDDKKEEIHQMQLQFFTNISHEFRTPLSLITGPIEKLLKEEVDTKNIHVYHVIQRNANRLLQLINELMDFRKVESGVLKLQVMPGSIPLFLDEITEGFSELANQKNISFTSSVKTNLNEFWFDRQVLEKIIINLLSNSFKYTNNYGKVDLMVFDSLKEFNPKYENKIQLKHKYSTGRFIHFLISDNGMGISEESLHHLFERYYRVSDIQIGSGIGLALIKTLTQLHKGNIEVYSKHKEGTEILVSIPINKTAYSKEEQWMKDTESIVKLESISKMYTLNSIEENVNKEVKESIATKKYVILIVDDHEELRMFLKESLEPKYKIIEAANGEKAIDETMKHFPDLIISDIMMPIMDGIDCCKIIKSTIETAHIPFIMLTAKDGLESRIEGTETGADYYFSKPISIDLLKLTINNIFLQKEKLKSFYLNEKNAEIKALAQSSVDKKFLDELLNIIENNMSKVDLDIDFVCKEIGMSRTKLYNKIKNISGQSIADFIRTLRLRKAALLMAQGELTISDIMYQVGIQTQSYFSKAFKQEFGKSPTQYMKDL
jgi:signal transduction histidine kinase/ligand-binding sensor domain-containing protein/DNA-binding response OmpR family regulator